MSRTEVYREIAEVKEVFSPVPESCLILFSAPRIAGSIKPGQFVNVLPPNQVDITASSVRLPTEEDLDQGDNKYSTAHTFLLRRPFSLHGYGDLGNGGADSFSILFRTRGKGTALIGQLQVGDKVDILGPLGHPYPLPEDSAQPVFILAGGFGVAPLVPLAEEISTRGNPVFFFWGVETVQSITLPTTKARAENKHFSPLALGRLDAKSIPSFIAVRQAASDTFQGTVLQLFHDFLGDNLAKAIISPVRKKPIIYSCGPEAMMKNVADLTGELGWECRVSLEKYMACGLGACMSCVCRIKKPGQPPQFNYLRTCTDGPSFRGEDVLWDL